MNYQGFLGVIVFMFIAYIFSSNRKAIDWKLVFWGLGLQFIMAGIILGNMVISLGMLFLFVSIIVAYNLYCISPILSQRPIINICFIIMTTLGLSFLFYKFGNKATSVRNIIWNIFLFTGFLRVVFQNHTTFGLPKQWSNVMGILVCTSVFGALWATNTTGAHLFKEVGDNITYFLSYGSAGGSFYFGDLYTGSVGWIFALNVSVSLIFFTAVISLFDSLGLLNQVIVSVSRFIYWNMVSTGITPLSGAETVVSIGSIPLGGNNVLFIKSYLDRLTSSEILLILVGIMSTISASLFAAFVSIGVSASHLLAASAMSVPAAIVLSKIVMPEVEKPITLGEDIEIIKNQDYGKPLSAIMTGISEGIQISLFMGGALIVFISLIAMIDDGLLKLDSYIDGDLLSFIFNGQKNSFGEFAGVFPGSLKTLFGHLFAPLAFAMGTPIEDLLKVGYLMGTKISVNEFVAFTQLGDFIKNSELQPSSVVIASFALCGFANPGTLAIVLGTVFPYVREKKEVYIKFGFYSLFLGAMASWMTASIASLFVKFI